MFAHNAETAQYRPALQPNVDDEAKVNQVKVDIHPGVIIHITAADIQTKLTAFPDSAAIKFMKRIHHASLWARCGRGFYVSNINGWSEWNPLH